MDSQIRKKNGHIPSDYWYAHALTKKVHCAHSVDRQRAIIKVPACSRLLQKHLWHISCSSGIMRPLAKSLPLVCAGLYPIDHFRGACTVNRNVLVVPVGHVKRVYYEDAFDTLNVVRKRWRVIIPYSNLIWHGSSGPIWAKPREYFSICNVIVTE